MSDESIEVEILDTVTGEREWAGEEAKFNAYWWHEGNGSCDCNRRLRHSRRLKRRARKDTARMQPVPDRRD